MCRAKSKTTSDRRHVEPRSASNGDVSRTGDGTGTRQSKCAGIDGRRSGIGVSAVQGQRAGAILRQTAVRGIVAADGGVLQRLANGDVESGGVNFRAAVADVRASQALHKSGIVSGGFERAAVEIEGIAA